MENENTPNDSDAASASADASATPPNATPLPLVDAEGNFTSKQWSDDAALCEKFTSLAALSKSYRHLESLVGKKGLVPPGDDAAPEQVDAFYRQLGRPDTAAAYVFEKPEDFPNDAAFNEKRLGAFKEAAYAAGLSQRQFGALVDWANRYESGEVAAWNAQKERAQKTSVEILRADPELGGDAFDGTLALARKVAMRFGDETLVNDSAFGDRPDVIRLLARIGRAMGEDGMAAVQDGGDRAAKGRIDAVFGDKNDPYWDARHPEHERRVEEVSRLFARAHPES